VPEFDFYTTLDEHIRMLEAILEENQLRFAFDEWYPSPSCPTYAEVNAALAAKIRGGSSRMYLLGDFTTKGLFFNRHDEGDLAGWHKINISRLGPLIDFSLPGWFIEEGIRRITNGNLHHPAEYWNADITECFEASEAVRAAYAGIKRTLKKWVKRVDFHAPIWVSQPALDLARSCKATLLVNGDWVCGPPGQLSIQRRPQVGVTRTV
jgi:hypothetical protein